MGNNKAPRSDIIDDLLEGIQDVDITTLSKSSTTRNLVNEYGEIEDQVINDFSKACKEWF